jgi:hypothetical protein
MPGFFHWNDTLAYFSFVQVSRRYGSLSNHDGYVEQSKQSKLSPFKIIHVSQLSPKSCWNLWSKQPPHFNYVFNYVHSGPSRLSALEISSITCDTAFAFILPWHVSISFDHLQRVIFSLYTLTQSRDYCLYPKVVYIVLHVTLTSMNHHISACVRAGVR